MKKLLLLSLIALFTFGIASTQKTFGATGDSFDDPIILSDTGIVNFPANTEALYYAFTLNEHKVMVISEGESYYSMVYDVNQNILDYGYDAQQKYNLEAGTYIIKITNPHSDLQAFDWTISIHDLLPGEFPENSILITESGTITIAEGIRDMHYTFTATEDGFMCLKNINVNYFVQNANTYNYITDNIHNNGFVKEIKYGETYNILIDVAEKTGTIWNFIIADGEGQSCYRPIQLTNYSSVTTKIGAGISYYKFTNPEKGAIHIASNKNNHVALYRNCDEIDDSGNNSIAFSNTGELNYFAQTNETFYIVWKTYSANVYSSEEFSWSITKTIIPGFDCNTPIVIENTGNVIFTEGAEELYYSYTATKNCRLAINCGNFTNKQIRWYADCETDQANQTGFDGNLTIFAKKGEHYLLKWTNDFYNHEEFIWNINEEDFTGGETCENPIEITTSGDIDFNESNCALYYKYTPTVDGFLILNSSTSNIIELYHTCNENYYAIESGKSKSEVKNGEPVLIKWINENSETFIWNLSELEGSIGQVCAKPIVISSIGDEANPTSISYNETNNIVYYSFTPSTTKVLEITSSTTYNKAKISTNCNFENAQYSQSGKLCTEVEAGITYIIQWEDLSPAGFSWDAYLRDAIPGESFAPIVLTDAGTINYPANNYEVYYTFTATKNCVVSFESDHPGTWTNMGSPTYLSTGEVLTFSWNNAAADAFSWTFGIADIIEGESCENAIIINNVGSFTCPTNLERTYYSYTPTSNLTVMVTDNTLETTVYIHEGCNFSSYYSNQFGEIAFEAKAGTNYIIRYDNKGVATEFNLTTNTPAEGESASNPKDITPEGDISYIGLDKGLVRSYYSFSSTKNQELKIGFVEYLIISDATSGEIMAEEYYVEGDFTFHFKKDVTYYFTCERGYRPETTWAFSPVGSSNNKSNIKIQVNAYGRPVKEANITINNQSLTTNYNGYVEIELESDTYNYSVAANNYIDVTGVIVVDKLDQFVTLDLISTSDAFRLVNFKVSSNNQPIENAEIRINNTVLFTNTNGESKHEFAGTQEYKVLATGYKEFSGSFTINTETMKHNENIILSKIGSTEYLVTFTTKSNSSILENVSILINGQTLTSNANGEATINLPNGSYDFSASLSGFETFSSQVIVADANKNIDIDMVVVGVNALLHTNFNLYPNPTQGKITLEMPTQINQIQVFTIEGAMVLNKNQPLNNEINIQHLQNGIYILRIISKGQIINRKITKY